MNLENQVVSLELSKKLKELGFEQESLFCWCDTPEKEKELLFTDNIPDYSTCIQAYTVEELGKMLPDKIKSEFPNSWVSGKDERYFCAYETADHSLHDCYADTEADARAKMLIYLKENKLI